MTADRRAIKPQQVQELIAKLEHKESCYRDELIDAVIEYASTDESDHRDLAYIGGLVKGVQQCIALVREYGTEGS